MYQGLKFGKNLAHPFYIFIVVLMVENYNEFTVVQIQNFYELFVKDKKRGMDLMGISDPLDGLF